MIDALLAKVFGTKNEREIKAMRPVIAAINDLEPAMQQLSDEELAAKTIEFRERLANGATLDDLLVEAFAVVREGGRRVLNMRHFDVQLIGGYVLHHGKIAEMRTGEGKTLVATLPVYLNALAGRGVHLVTVNDYLAQRDADWMGRIYRFLGLTVGVNLSQMNHADKQAAYAADVTYGTNNEFGFDYLRDNMVFQASERVQRGLNYAIVDEVDSILIDEARTPLIISGQADDNVELYYRLNDLAPKLQRQSEEQGPGDYWVDEKAHQVLLSESGHEHAENILTDAGLLLAGTSLYDAHNISLMHHLYAALRAHALFHRDRHYVDRELRNAVGASREAEASAPGAERQAARARGRDRRAGRASEDGHHRDQHGRPRHRYRARRCRRAAHPQDPRRRSADADREGPADRQAALGVAGSPRGRHRRRRPAYRWHRAPRVAPHRQSAARPVRPPGRSRLVAFLPFARRSAAAHLRRRAA